MPDQPDERVRAFVYLLEENWYVSIRTSVLGHQVKIDKDPLPSGIFFIGVSRKKAVFGPFRIDGEQYYELTAIGFYRLEETNPEFGIFKLDKRSCPWRFRFQADPPDLEIKHGLYWPKIAKLLDLNPKGWRNLKDVLLTDEQIEYLAKIFRELQTQEAPNKWIPTLQPFKPS